jgi:myo-inositol-1(or 4)-monophosphatase
MTTATVRKAHLKEALSTAVGAAQQAGKLMRDNFRSAKKIDSQTQHDIKLELDVRCQKRIEKVLRSNFPGCAVLGEEGVLGDPRAEFRWVVDPIDGTVNFTYGIPHACVSIALQGQRSEVRDQRSEIRGKGFASKQHATRDTPYNTLLGVVYDPFCNELWRALRGQPARLNGRLIHVSRRRKLHEAIVALGFAKHRFTLERMLPIFNQLIHRVRKIRIMGAAALSLVYVASGRLDAYTEYGVNLWDIAAGGLILESAGGEFWHRPVDGQYAYHIIANNGLLRQRLRKLG